MLSATITPNLWFNGQAEEAANHYVSIFANSRITHVYKLSQDIQTPSAVAFELSGQPFIAINGGDEVRFTPAVSFQIECETQKEIDYFWERLGRGGDERRRAAGWLVDKYGVSWQVSAKKMTELAKGADRETTEKLATAVLGMTKIELSALEGL